MGNMIRNSLAVFFVAISGAVSASTTAERMIKPPRLTRGNTSILPVQPIDQAAWLSHPDIKDEVAYPGKPRIVRFRCEFTSDGSPLEFDVTGDERYYLRSTASSSPAAPIAARWRIGCTKATGPSSRRASM